MKRLSSILLTFMMVLGFMAMSANVAFADELNVTSTTESRGFTDKTEAVMTLEPNPYRVSVEISGINITADNAVSVTLFSGGKKLSTATLLLEVKGTRLTCPFYLGANNEVDWTYDPGFQPKTTEMPDRVEVTIDDETRNFPLSHVKNNPLNRKTWVSNELVKNPVEPTSQETQVGASVEPTFVVTIPRNVDFGTLSKNMPGQSRPFVVAVNNALIETDAIIAITLKDKIAMKANNIAELDYKLINSEGEVGNNQEFCSFDWDSVKDSGSSSKTGYVTCKPSSLKAAGSYSGTMTFEISYKYNYPN